MIAHSFFVNLLAHFTSALEQKGKLPELEVFIMGRTNDALQVQPKVDQCTEQLAKTIDNMVCYQGKTLGEYECHFSINVVKQSIEYGVVC